MLTDANMRDAPEQELSVQIADVYGVHVDNMDILEPRQSKVREDLTSQTSGTNDQDLALAPKECFDLDTSAGKIASVNISCKDGVGLAYFFPGEERRISSWTRSIENLVYMVVPGLPVCRLCCPVQNHHRLVTGGTMGDRWRLWKTDQALQIQFPTMGRRDSKQN